MSVLVLASFFLLGVGAEAWGITCAQHKEHAAGQTPSSIAHPTDSHNQHRNDSQNLHDQEHESEGSCKCLCCANDADVPIGSPRAVFTFHRFADTGHEPAAALQRWTPAERSSYFLPFANAPPLR